MDIKIRLARASDIKEYTSFLFKAYQSAYVDESIGLAICCFSEEIFKADERQEYLKARLVNSDMQKTWLAFDGERLVGTVTCAIKGDNEVELAGFYVLPEYQGKGIGKKLYNLVLGFAGERDLVLDVYAHRIKTIEIYKKWGWVFDETQGEEGFSVRHWPEWPKGVAVKIMFMRLKRQVC